MSALAVSLCFMSLALFCNLKSVHSGSTPDLPRGVALKYKPFYENKKEFKCIDGSDTIAFTYVNDDYCDCADGSDEPGTSACVNGRFHCVNLGHQPMNVISSRVNDYVCDCCDGSDEYSNTVHCPNICDELGRKARQEAIRVANMHKEGFEKRKEMAKEGTKLKQEKTVAIEQLKKEKVEMEPYRQELELKKKDAETAESEAKKKHEETWEAEKAKVKAEKTAVDATAAFIVLDVNNDGKITPDELLSHIEFDKNGDGSVTLEEGQEWLADDTVDLDKFIHVTWDVVKDAWNLKLEKINGMTEKDGGFNELSPEIVTPSYDSDSRDHDEDDDSESEMPPEPEEVDDFDPEKYKREGEDTSKKDKDDDDDDPPPFDDVTLQLIAVADAARDAFDEVDRKYREADDEIRRIQDFLDLDLGPESVFASMVKQCITYHESAYTYQVCMFEKTNQTPQSGGMQTSLGVWGKWIGPAENRYSMMKFEHGQNCWNGPDRSTTVKLQCGSENKVTSASEPSRCEYLMTMETPAACLAATSMDEHVEL